MRLPDATKFYIDGRWLAPCGPKRAEVIDPASVRPVAAVALGDARDAEKAICAARAAFDGWSRSSVPERLTVLRRINELLHARADEIGDAISAEMGAPIRLARGAQAGSGPQHFEEVIRLLRDYRFESMLGDTLVRREAVGVCSLITPWNWPINQIASKVAPAIAAGCTMVLKPSELAPLDAVIFAEIVDEAGLPPGVFNLVHGTGEDLGETLTGHVEVDMISFTGSTSAGVMIGQIAAKSVKRVALELGGKSANIILPSADFSHAIPNSVRACMLNSGQSCNAPTRLLVPRSRLDEAYASAAAAAESLAVGPPGEDPDLGPVANRTQYERVISMIERAVSDGARLVAGGSDRIAGLKGYFVRPTVLAAEPDMAVAREEVFGPVLTVLAYDDVDQAIALANDSPYGLSGYVWGQDEAEASNVARRLRTGMVHINGAGLDSAAPFGGYKMSGNGREWGVFGLEEFLEVKSVYGGVAKAA